MTSEKKVQCHRTPHFMPHFMPPLNSLIFMRFSANIFAKQECIPVGCVPLAWPYTSMHWVGVVFQHALGRGCVSQHAQGRALYPSMHWAEGCVCQGGVSTKGRGCLSRGCGRQPIHPRDSPHTHTPQHPTHPWDQRQPPLHEQNDWQTDVKTLPSLNFVCGW